MAVFFYLSALILPICYELRKTTASEETKTELSDFDSSVHDIPYTVDAQGYLYELE